VLVLALDTATDAVAVGLLEVPPGRDGSPTVLGAEVRPGARQHGEQLMPAVLRVCAAAGHALADVDAVVCGAGPGPFTGLRVGLVTAAGLGDALGVPVYGVCSLDAVAAEVFGATEGAAASAAASGAAAAPCGATDGAAASGAAASGGATDGAAAVADPLLVVSDARRREVYWAAYDGRGRRVVGPAVGSPAEVASRVAELGVRRVAGPVAAAHAELFGLPEFPSAGAALAPTPAGLVAAAGAELGSGREPAPPRPYYLRRPDAVPPGERKRAVPAAEHQLAAAQHPPAAEHRLAAAQHPPAAAGHRPAAGHQLAAAAPRSAAARSTALAGGREREHGRGDLG